MTERQTKKHLIAWATGIPFPGRECGPGSAAIVLDDTSQLEKVLRSDLCDQGSVIFAPGADPRIDPRVVPYDGSISEPGSEFILREEFYLQIQNYAVSEFMSIVGPALVRVTDETDFATYLADADRALSEGVLPEFLIHPGMQLADLSALGAGPAGDGPRQRLHVAADGGLSTSPSGSLIGSVRDNLATVETSWAQANLNSLAACSICLGAAVPDQVRGPAVKARPWLGRYLTVIQAVRHVRFRGESSPLAISGFAERLNSSLAGFPSPADADDDRLPVLLWTGSSGYVFVPEGNRIFKVDLPAAELIEALLVCGSISAASAFVDVSGLRQVLAYFWAAGVRIESDDLTVVV